LRGSVGRPRCAARTRDRLAGRRVASTNRQAAHWD
jgi:hypothetical protein